MLNLSPLRLTSSKWTQTGYSYTALGLSNRLARRRRLHFQEPVRRPASTFHVHTVRKSKQVAQYYFQE